MADDSGGIPAQEEARLAFVGMQVFDDTIRGGALVTDIATTPIEFRCTSPIEPTSLQKVLYGRQLESYVATQLIGDPVLKALREKPNLVIAMSPAFLGLRKKVRIPVVVVFTQQTAASAGLSDDEAKTGTITSQDGSFEPVIVKAHADFRDDGVIARRLLQPVLMNHSIVEPFERINTALGLLHHSERR